MVLIALDNRVMNLHAKCARVHTVRDFRPSHKHFTTTPVVHHHILILASVFGRTGGCVRICEL